MLSKELRKQNKGIKREVQRPLERSFQVFYIQMQESRQKKIRRNWQTRM